MIFKVRAHGTTWMINKLNQCYQSRRIESKGFTILLLLDFSSAFDTIDHQVLISRLQDLLGISGTPLSWFASYLSDRTQRVRIDSSFSSHCLKFGVPQRSVLGPLILIYILPPWEHSPQVWLGTAFIC